MEVVCIGCLSSDRKLTQIKDLSVNQIFSELVYEFQNSETSIPVALCWECKATLYRFVKFRAKVKRCRSIVEDCLRNSIAISKLETQSSLKTEIIYQHNITPLKTSDFYKEENNSTGIKDEKNDCTFQISNAQTYWPSTDYVTEDIKNDYTSDYSNEEETLADIKKEKTKQKLKVKKKKPARIKLQSECYTEVVLNEKEVEQERMMQAAKEEYANSVYKCEMCILPFSNTDDFSDHTNLKHNLASKHSCSICDCKFSNEVSFNYHMNRHVKRYECNKCKDRFATARKAERHYESHVYVASYKCDECSDEFGTHLELEIHTLQIHKIPESTANEVENKLEIDKSSVSQGESYPCSACNKTFKWKTSLRKHMETHRIEQGAKRRPHCETCRLSFTTTSSLQKHMRTSSKHQLLLQKSKLPEGVTTTIKPVEGAFRCSLCGHSYQWRGNLRRHMETHKMRLRKQQAKSIENKENAPPVVSASGALVCVPCDRTFSSLATYQQHLRCSRRHISEEDFQYVCTDCGARFVSKTKLKDHMDWEHLKRYTHVCESCQKVFKSHTSLYLHRQVAHSGAARHLCDHCGKGFPTLTKMRTHVTALHLGKAAHTCQVCNAKFNWSSCLSRHIRTMHKTEQP